MQKKTFPWWKEFFKQYVLQGEYTTEIEGFSLTKRWLWKILANVNKHYQYKNIHAGIKVIMKKTTEERYFYHWTTTVVVRLYISAERNFS